MQTPIRGPFGSASCSVVSTQPVRARSHRNSRASALTTETFAESMCQQIEVYMWVCTMGTVQYKLLNFLQCCFFSEFRKRCDQANVACSQLRCIIWPFNDFCAFISLLSLSVLYICTMFYDLLNGILVAPLKVSLYHSLPSSIPETLSSLTIASCPLRVLTLLIVFLVQLIAPRQFEHQSPFWLSALSNRLFHCKPWIFSFPAPHAS